MREIIIPKGDYGWDIPFTITNADGTPKVLTDYTIKLKVWAAEDSGSLLIDTACDIDDANAGTCHYTILITNFTTAGDFLGELELTKTGIVESTEIFKIIVKDSG